MESTTTLAVYKSTLGWRVRGMHLFGFIPYIADGIEDEDTIRLILGQILNLAEQLLLDLARKRGNLSIAEFISMLQEHHLPDCCPNGLKTWDYIVPHLHDSHELSALLEEIARHS